MRVSRSWVGAPGRSASAGDTWAARMSDRRTLPVRGIGEHRGPGGRRAAGGGSYRDRGPGRRLSAGLVGVRDQFLCNLTVRSSVRAGNGPRQIEPGATRWPTVHARVRAHPVVLDVLARVPSSSVRSPRCERELLGQVPRREASRVPVQVRAVVKYTHRPTSAKSTSAATAMGPKTLTPAIRTTAPMTPMANSEPHSSATPRGGRRILIRPRSDVGRRGHLGRAPTHWA